MSGWTDAEKIALLVALVEAKGPPDFSRVSLPNRTEKACRHLWAKMKEEAKKAPGYVEGETPTKATATPRKRAAKPTDDDEETPKKKKAKKEEIKEETADEA